MRDDEEGTLARYRAHRTELVEPKIAEYNGGNPMGLWCGGLGELVQLVASQTLDLWGR